MGTSEGAKKAWETRRKQQPKEARQETVKTTIRVKKELWNAALHRTIDEEITSQELVERALESYLGKQKGGRQ